MKLIDRLIVLVLSLVVVAVGVLAIMGSFHTAGASAYLTTALTQLFTYRWLILLAGSLCVIMGMIFIFTSAFRSNKNPQPKLLKTAAYGEDIQISIGAVEAIIQQTAKQNQAIDEVGTAIFQEAQGVVVQVTLKVRADQDIAGISLSVQDRIKTQLENMVGLQVAKVHVIVADISPVSDFAYSPVSEPVSEPVAVTKEQEAI